MSNTIAEYFATLKLKPDAGSIRKVDQFFRVLEARIERASKRVGAKAEGLGISNPANATKQASAIKQVAQAQVRATDSVTKAQEKLNKARRVELATERLRQSSIRLDRSALRLAQNPKTNSTPRSSRSFGLRDTMHTIAAVGVAGYGIGQLNDVSQRLEMLPVSMEAVTGSAAKAAQQLEFLAKLGHEMGATRLELAPEYTKMLASAVGTPLESQMPTIFSAMTRYGKVMGLEPEEMKGSFKAVSQMVNKQQIMAEELKGQLAERLPAAVRIMADAVTGGDTKKLFALMKNGGLDPNTALPKFAMELEKRAAGGMEAYKKTQRGQQNFARVALEDQMINFGNWGGNSAFFKIWKSFADTLPKLNGFVKLLTRAFSGLAQVIEGLGIILQGISTLFDIFYSLPKDIQYLGEVAGTVFTAMAIRAGFLGKVLARTFLPLTAAYLILEDMAYGMAGEDSITKRGMDYFKSGDSTSSKVLNTLGMVTNPTALIVSGIANKFANKDDTSFSGNKMIEALTNPTGSMQNYSITVDVTGDTTDHERIAQQVGDQLKGVFTTLIFNKVPVE